MNQTSLPGLITGRLLCFSAILLFGCGGGGGNHEPEDPVVPVVVLPRLQDSRTFSPSVEDALAPLSDLAVETDRWVGILNGSAYRIEVPKQWNGKLLMWARGYWGIGAPSLYIENPLIRRHLLQKGYAWAVSSYSRNGYDVNAGIEDTNRLANEFRAIAASRGRVLELPRRTYIAGMSMGGHIAAAAVEAEVVRDARNPLRYDGALSLCGSVNGVEWYGYMAAYQMAMQQLLAFPAEKYPSQAYAENRLTMRAVIDDAVKRRDLSQTEVAKLYALMEQLSGGRRPFFHEGWMDPYHHNILFLLMNGQSSLDGILAQGGIDTRHHVYRFNADTQPDAEAKQFNDSIRRVIPEAVDANPVQKQGLRWIPLVAGQLTAPVMALHTLGDLTVPINTQFEYRQRAKKQGKDDLLTQRLIRDVGHCSFTAAELATAFDELVLWAEQGRKPRGDDLGDAGLLMRQDVGCTHTDNRVQPDDRTNSVQRAKVQAAYPACPSL